MSDMPWFPFHVADFLNSRRVRTMTPEQVGVYVLLLCHQWDGGPLEDDPAVLSSLTNGCDPNTVRTVLERCFNDTHEGWVNLRLEEVREEQEEKVEKKRAAGRASGKSRRQKRMERRSNGVRGVLEHNLNKNEQEEEIREEEKRREKPSAVPAASAKKERATKLPADWSPTDEHRQRAKAEGVSVEREAEKFRLHAETNARKAVRWNAAFTQWLIKAGEMGGRANGVLALLPEERIPDGEGGYRITRR